MLKKAIPLLHISDSLTAESFYCNTLGFKLAFIYRPHEGLQEPAFLGFTRDGVWLHASSFSGDGIAGNVASFVVESVDDLYQEFLAKSATIDLVPTDQSWGNREMYMTDPDGNSLRFLQYE